MSQEEYLDVTVFCADRRVSRAEFKEYMFGLSTPWPDSIQVARELAAAGRTRLATLNNESEALNVHRLERFALHAIFPTFFTSCWLGVRKPMRRFYNSALGIAHARPGDSLFIDDRQQNLTPAASLGMSVLLYKSAPQLRSDLERFLDLKITGA